MLFNSYIFVLLFLPLTLIGYFGISHFHKYTLANVFLIGMSLWFYGYYSPKYLLVIGTSILFNYAWSRWMNHRKPWLIFGIAVNLASIFYYKYYDFFVGSINAAAGTDFVLKNVVLPLGISFFTFQQISYLVDSYRGETKDYGFIEYVLFVVFFPQLIAGPIVLHSEMIPQFRDTKRRTVNYQNLTHGLYVFAVGLFKKVMIADTLSKAVTWGYATVADLSITEAVIVALSYTLQLYFDFSGYCDMASGICCMMNIKLPQNFNSPYRATSIRDYWSRWHLSLTRFLTTYVYIPLGGSRAGKWKTYRNIMIVYLVSGIWHGANWTYIVWGVEQGILVCANRAGEKIWEKLPQPLRWLINFVIINLGLIIFRADSLSQAGSFYKRLFSIGEHPAFTVRAALANCFRLKEFSFFVPDYVMMALILFAVLLLSVFAKNSGEIKFEKTKRRAFMTILLMAWSILSLNGVSEFLYFGF
jgi:D-alanyl-lipoteichoic acid acyltransferase DltB (MBOAT superfamily)